MANQIVVSSGAKVRNLEGVLTGTSGVVSSVPLGAANGVATLDSGGKVPVSQLPSSVVTYLGTWNAATNTPTLVNGTGDAGDLYLCNVAGTVNFGAGPIVFVIGDWVLYGSGTWQKSNGQNGTVTSVAASITGNSLGITGSPITTAGTLAFAFAGTSGQYVNGAGNLTTFPTLITSIGLSMPSAFSVANSPLTANGSINVTGAGTTGQYIRGDGSLATYNPSSGGGGSSQTFYFNGSVASSVTGYQQMSTTANTGASADFSVSSNGYIASFLTDSGSPNQLLIPAGNWNFEIYMNSSSAGGSPNFYVELYKYNGSTFTLISSSSANPEYITNGTAVDLYTTALTVPQTTLTLTDRLAVRVYVVTSGRTITMHTQDSNLSEVITTFSTGITALNGLTAQVQNFAVGTGGSDFNISSVTATHTFNLPVASATNTGKLSSTDWSTFNNKVPYTGATANVDLGLFSLTSNIVKVIGDNSTYGGTLSIRQSNVTNLIGVGYTELFGKTNILGISFGVGSIAYISNSVLTAARTYTLPDATGTLALTSDLTSGYVPYTGAMLSLDLGIYSYNGNNVIINGNNSTQNGTLLFKQVGGLAFNSVGYSGVGILGTTSMHFNFNQSSGVYKQFNFNVNSLTNNTLRTLNIPDASGTLALLSADQTFTGINSFDYAINYKTGASLANVSGYISQAYAVSGTGAGSTLSLKISDGNSVKAINLDFVGSPATYTYTFPNTSGTIALTSNLSSYLPLAGGIMTGSILLNNNLTISGQLFGTSSYASMIAMSPSDKVLIDNSGRGVNFGGTIGNGTYTYTLPSATGTLALTSQLTSGTVTSVAALTLGTTGTDVSSSVANSTTTPVITLNVPTASASNRGALSSADWTTFNNKQNALTNPVTGTGASGRVALWSGTTTQTSSVGLTFDSTNAVLTSGTYYSYNNVGAAYNLSSNGDNVGKIQNVTSLSWALAYGGSSSIYPLGTAVLTWDTTNKVTFAGTLSNGTYTYTLPSATGTLALTSSLSSYLPLTGGTLTGQLYINPTNTATVGLDVASDTIRFRSDNLEGFKRQLVMTMGSGTLIQMVASGFGGTYGTDLAFYTSSASGVNGSPAMYITGGNQIGLGTGSPAYTLDVSGTGRFTTGLVTNSAITINQNQNATSTSTFINNDTTNTSSRQIVNITSGNVTSALTSIHNDHSYFNVTNNLYFQSGGGVKMTMLSTGNVGIGTSSPARTLSVQGIGGFYNTSGANDSQLLVYNDGTNSIISSTYGSTGAFLPIVFITSSTEKMRITSGGSVVAGSILAVPTGGEVGAWCWIPSQNRAYFSSTSSAAAGFNRFGNTGEVIAFNYGGAGIGSISTNGSTTSFNTTSDYRLKEDFQETKGLEKVLGIKIYNFKYKNSENRMDGVLAHELKDILFYAVQGEKDDEEMQSVDYSKLTPILVKAVQEQQVQIQNLQEQINILAK